MERTIAASRFKISNRGILYVRKNLAAINDACMQDQIPESLVNDQDDTVAESLRSKDPDLKDVIIKEGIKNIGNLPRLIEHASALFASSA